MRPRRYQIVDAGGVLDRVATADPPVRVAFLQLLERLEQDPLPGDGNILVFQDPRRPNGFTAAFDDGLVVYQVMKDQPVVKLIDVLWP